MKSFFLATAVFAISISAFGQLSKSTWLIGGNGSFYSYSEDYSTPNYNQTAKIINVDVTASFGYFIVDKFAVGVRPYLSTYKSKVTSTSVGVGAPTYGFQIALGPFVRYYFLEKEKPFNILADVSYQLGINKFQVTPTQKGEFNTFCFMGGTAIFFNSTASIEILLGYKQQIETLTSAYNRNKKGIQASIGFTLHLEKL